MDRPGLLDWLIAPLTLLERTRGWRRRGLILLYLVIALVVGVFGWRELTLWRLPRAPEPFDVAGLGRPAIPDAENAMVVYRALHARVGELDVTGYKADPKSWGVTD